MEYTVRIVWDAEAAVWIAESDDIAGLVLECGSLDTLIERVWVAVPELLELNKQLACEQILFKIKRHERLR